MTQYDVAFWNLNKNGEIDEKTKALAEYAIARKVPILTKEDFENARFEETAFRTAMGYVVYGAGNSHVRNVVLGILRKNRECYVVKDMIDDTTQNSLEEMVKAGAKLITTQDVLNRKVI